MDKMKEIPFIVPTPEEQRAIVEYIPRICEAYDAEIEKLQRKIDLLLEQKNKLISEIVTGRATTSNTGLLQNKD